MRIGVVITIVGAPDARNAAGRPALAGLVLPQGAGKQGAHPPILRRSVPVGR